MLYGEVVVSGKKLNNLRKSVPEASDKRELSCRAIIQGLPLYNQTFSGSSESPDFWTRLSSSEALGRTQTQ